MRKKPRKHGGEHQWVTEGMGPTHCLKCGAPINGSSGVSRPDVSGSSERGDTSQPEREKADDLRAPTSRTDGIDEFIPD